MYRTRIVLYTLGGLAVTASGLLLTKDGIHYNLILAPLCFGVSILCLLFAVYEEHAHGLSPEKFSLLRKIVYIAGPILPICLGAMYKWGPIEGLLVGLCLSTFLWWEVDQWSTYDASTYGSGG